MRARGIARRATVALLALSTVMAPTPADAAQGRSIQINLPGPVAVLGIRDRHTIYRNADGVLFFLEPKTGDVRILPPGTTFRPMRPGSELVTILLIDPKGNVLQKNAQGVAFHLDAKTGARVFVKWPK